MSCLVITIALVASPTLATEPVPSASANVVEVVAGPVATVQLEPQAAMSLEATPQATADVAPLAPLNMIAGEVCTVGTGTIVVLAARDGVLRTPNGGFFLLNPATNPQD